MTAALAGSVPDIAGFRFPPEPFDALLASLGWPERDRWVRAWLDRGGAALAPEAWRSTPGADWIWGLALPLLSQLEQLAAEPRPTILGLTASPATGKSTLCRWLRSAARQIGIQIETLSLDDFYYPSPLLEESLRGNPWGVGRGLPGSHDTALMLQCLEDWRQGRDVSVPVFEKTRRGGRGDRAGFRPLRGSLLLLEGWFVGVPGDQAGSGETPSQTRPSAAAAPETDTDTTPETAAVRALEEALSEVLRSELSEAEITYRATVQKALQSYAPIWRQIDRLWRIRALDLRATALWKQQQHSFTLNRPEADQFIRMLLCSLPAGSWERIASDVLVEIDPLRTIHWIGLTPSRAGGAGGAGG